MKRGSKSKRCTLSSDVLTPAQWRKKNGDVKKMDMQKPTTLKDFRTWPVDLQKEYLQKYIDEFGCSQADLAQIFNVSPAGLQKHLREIAFDLSCFKRGGRMSSYNRQRFRAWLATYRPDFQTQARCEEPAVLEPQERLSGQEAESGREMPVPIESHSAMKISKMTFDFVGTLNMPQIIKMVAPFADGRSVKMQVIVEEADL